MLDTERLIYAFLQGYARNLLADIDDDKMTAQPSAGVNHPAWLIGHLTLAAELTARLLGGAADFTEQAQKLYGPGSIPIPERGAYPSKAVLIAAYDAAHAKVDGLAAAATAELLAAPNNVPFERLRKSFPTIGDQVAFLLSGHEATHIGHLSNWRRQMGLHFLF